MDPCPKFAILSHVLPPSSTGQAIVLHRLLKDLPRERYCLLSVRDYQAPAEPSAVPENACSHLPARYHYLPPRLYFQGRLWRRTEPFRGAASLTLQVFHRARKITRILRSEGCQALIACTGELIDMPAGYLAARRLGIRFFPYLFDDYVSQWTNPQRRLFAKLAAPWIMRGSTGVIAPNEFLAEVYHVRYKIEPLVIHNAVDLPEGPPGLEGPWPHGPGRVRILYTGAIYDAHYDAFRNLAAALQILKRDDVRLHLYTGCPPKTLDEKGITGKVVVHEHVPMEEAVKLQQTADMLFLPLAFQSPYPEIIKTSAPGKMGEYLASGRPIVAHVPQDSFVAWYLRKHECGLVVTAPDVGELAAGVATLCDNPQLRSRLVNNALARARTDFGVPAARTKLLEALRGSEALRCAS